MSSPDVHGCLACDLTHGRTDLPGGRILATEHWVVEPCVGPLPAGTVIVKPLRHCLHVWDLTDQEAAELGPLLQRVSAAVRQIAKPDQVYVCLWSHAGWTPGHIHFVVQPSWDRLQSEYEHPGPSLQSAMFIANELPPRDEVKAFAEEARTVLKASGLDA